ncbi:HesA/MoeB/ThiF family protein [Micromonospora sp. AKA38]|uniref:HesA/MoeB/ThiF family protein n=1 Tax=Micromonospora sp. AKA38 TaxID=2733861 RepID=UPI0022C576B7|nr:ThiF family adenylyltransferase [Micromonospora sp. AKA38]GHJ15507.1 heme biosynthesis protein HemY [Micromonospora sp. AKA38]
MSFGIPADPRIKAIYSAYRFDERRFRIGAQRGITADFDDPDGQVWALVDALDGRPVGEVITTVRAQHPQLSAQDILDGIATLDAEGFVEAAEPGGRREAEIDERFLPNVRYFSRFSGLHGDRFAAHDRLRDARVLLLGLGGAGSNILTLLVGAGVGRLTVVDDDTVEAGNLGRQFLYRHADIGRLKAEVAAEVCAAVNPSCQVEPVVRRIESAEDVLALSGDVDLVVCAIDEPPVLSQRRVNTACVATEVPCVFGGSQVTRGRVFTVVPGQSGCVDCLYIHYSMKDPDFTKQFFGFLDSGMANPSIAYGPGMFLLTATMADEAVRVLTGYAPPRSISRQFELDYESGQAHQVLEWPRLADECPTCGAGREADWAIFSHHRFGAVGNPDLVRA